MISFFHAQRRRTDLVGVKTGLEWFSSQHFYVFLFLFFFNKKRCHEDRKTTGKVREENRR